MLGECVFIGVFFYHEGPFFFYNQWPPTLRENLRPQSSLIQRIEWSSLLPVVFYFWSVIVSLFQSIRFIFLSNNLSSKLPFFFQSSFLVISVEHEKRKRRLIDQHIVDSVVAFILPTSLSLTPMMTHLSPWM